MSGSHKFNVGDVIRNYKSPSTLVEVVLTFPQYVNTGRNAADMIINVNGVHQLRDSEDYELAPKPPLFFEAGKKYRCTHENGYHYDVEIVDVSEKWVIGWYLRNFTPFSWPSPNVPLNESWSEIK